jgi:peptidoglycan/xylan/chitin deacetylase (PgdA/CDA1 family)
MAKNNLFILNFHSIFRPNEKEKYHYDPVFSISEEQLKNYLNWIHSKKIRCAKWGTFLTNNYPPNNQIALSFDDGHLSDSDIAIPLLQYYQLDACFFIVAENIRKNQNERVRIKKISDLGFTIGSHGLTHKKLTQLSEEEQLIELIESKKIIEECIGKEIHFIAFPEGRFTNRLIKLSQKAGYSKTFSTYNKWNNANLLSNNFGRWSIKQSTSLNHFEKVLLKNKMTLFKNSFSSFMKFYLLKIIDLRTLKSK